MKSSNERSAGTPLYAVLAVYLPFSVVFSVCAFSGKLFAVQAPRLSIAWPLVLIVSALGCLAATLYFSLMRNNKSDHRIAGIRGGIALIILAYLVSSFVPHTLSGGGSIAQAPPLPERLFPSLTHCFSVLGVLFCWMETLSLKTMFADRELFESFTALYSGEKLQAAIREDALGMSAMLRQIRGTRRAYIFELIVIVLLASALGVLHIPLGPGFYILLVILLINALAIIALLGLFIREHTFAAEGITVQARDQARAFTSAAAFSVCAALGAVILARDASILPLSVLLDFFALLLALLSGLFKPGEGVSPKRFEVLHSDGFPGQLAPVMPELEAAEPWPYWEQLWAFLRYAFITIAVLGFLMFMLKPFFSRLGIAKGAIALIKNFRVFFKRWIAGFKQGFIDFFKSLGEKTAQVKLRKPNSEAISRISGSILDGLSPAKKQELRRNAGLFARLILWGTETLGIAWKPVFAPAEYCALLAEGLGSQNAEAAPVPQGRSIIRCGELFEKALYSLHSLSQAEHGEFKTLVDGITGGYL